MTDFQPQFPVDVAIIVEEEQANITLPGVSVDRNLVAHRFARLGKAAIEGGLTPEQAARGGLNPKMFNSFLDGSKPSIESAAVANATGLGVPSDGLLYPPASIADIPYVTRPQSEGGVLERKGMVEVISSLETDGRKIPYDIRMGVWVTVEAETDYIKNCFEEYMLQTDPSGRYSVMYKRWHLIGLEVGMSVASVGLRKEPTGCPIGFHADVIATAKRDLKPGEMLDGEGGYTVYGKLFPSEKSTSLGSLPLGLAHNVKLLKPIKAGQSLTYADVQMDESLTAVKLRREMERLFAPAAAKVRAHASPMPDAAPVTTTDSP